MMQHLADGFTAAAVFAGLWAAWLWWKASHADPDPGPGLESGQQEDRDRAWTMGLLQAATNSGRLNSQAAAWTAGSIAFQAAATVLGRLAMS